MHLFPRVNSDRERLLPMQITYLLLDEISQIYQTIKTFFVVWLQIVYLSKSEHVKIPNVLCSSILLNATSLVKFAGKLKSFSIIELVSYSLNHQSL